MMETESICSKIKEFLSISDKPISLEQKLNNCFDSESENKKQFIANILLNFVHNFSMFKEIKPFMESVYSCILKVLDIEFDSIENFNELLVKNAIMHFIQQYIEYSKLQQKRQILSFLSDSLEKLQVRPLIINLGLMLKPMYQDQEYLNKLKENEEIEVTYNLNSDIELKIKKQIDSWLQHQKIDLDDQESLKEKLCKEFERIINFFKIKRENCEQLFLEVLEMLNMKFTMVSLMESISEDSFEPIPIK